MERERKKTVLKLRVSHCQDYQPTTSHYSVHIYLCGSLRDDVMPFSVETVTQDR